MIILGGEGKGLRSLTKKDCDELKDKRKFRKGSLKQFKDLEQHLIRYNEICKQAIIDIDIAQERWISAENQF